MVAAQEIRKTFDLPPLSQQAPEPSAWTRCSRRPGASTTTFLEERKYGVRGAPGEEDRGRRPSSPGSRSAKATNPCRRRPQPPPAGGGHGPGPRLPGVLPPRQGEGGAGGTPASRDGIASARMGLEGVRQRLQGGRGAAQGAWASGAWPCAGTVTVEGQTKTTCAFTRKAGTSGTPRSPAWWTPRRCRRRARTWASTWGCTTSWRPQRRGSTSSTPTTTGRGGTACGSLQRTVAHRKKGGRLPRQAVRQLQRHHERVANQAAGFPQQGRSSACWWDYDRIALEALRIPNLVRNRHLSTSILDAGWGYLASHLTSKAASAGRGVCPGRPRVHSQECSGLWPAFRRAHPQRPLGALPGLWPVAGPGTTTPRLNILSAGGDTPVWTPNTRQWPR